MNFNRTQRKITLVGVALVACVGVAVSAKNPQTNQACLKPLADKSWNAAKARHLLARAGFGGGADEVARLHAMGLKRAIHFLVDFQSMPDTGPPFNAELPEAPDVASAAKLSPDERMKRMQELVRKDQEQLRRLREWWLGRMIETPRPLEEKLALFWHGHFATEQRTVRNSYAMWRQNQLFRAHAAGSFAKLLHAMVRDPAMLRYLDSNRNVRGRPNENLAREILELFSMGVGNYTESDIKEAARALTGYNFDRTAGEFRFVARAHDPGQKTIFGKTGNWDGDQLVDLILEQPATARFIARKLFVYFVHDSPDDRTVDRLAAILRKNNYCVAPLLKVLFQSEEFYSDRSTGTHIKSPVELTVGALRELQLRGGDRTALAVAIRAMGQDLFEPPNVKGWEGGKAWITTNTLFTRSNFAVGLLGSENSPIRFQVGRDANAKAKIKNAEFRKKIAADLPGLLTRAKRQTPDEIVDYLAATLLAVPLNAKQRTELLAFIAPLPASGEWESNKPQVDAKLRALVVLMMSLPQYQLS